MTKREKIEYKNYLIEVDEDGEVFLTSLISLETLWLTELLRYSYKDSEMAATAAKYWADHVPPEIIDVLTSGQTQRLEHIHEHDLDAEFEELSESHQQKTKKDKLS